MSVDQIIKSLGDIEVKIDKSKSLTSAELKSLGEQQTELANRLLKLETRSGSAPSVTWGEAFTKSDAYNGFVFNKQPDAHLEVKNTITNTVGNTPAGIVPGVVPGAFAPLTIENIFRSVPAADNSISYSRENVFTNAAAEVTEGSDSAESSITFTPTTLPIQTVAHWVKVSKQLADDAPALAAYINTRLAYGVQRRIDSQLVNGIGTNPNLSGIFKSGNYTAHGYADSMLGSVLKKHVLIRKTIADLVSSGYVPDAILLNPMDWMQFEIDMLTNNPTIASVADLNNGIPPRLFGVPVVQSASIAADTFAVGSFKLAGVIYNRGDVAIDMSYSDDDNFTKSLVTLMATRRLALAIEAPQAIRAGDLTPA